MTIVYVCPYCGATLTVETDDVKAAEKRVKEYQKKHRCVKK
jgi:uncharacterized Zn finger protein (UPF0148 family)